MRSSRIAYVTDSESLRRARVCGTCFDGAIHIVPHVTRIEKSTDETRRARREASAAVAGAVKKLRGVIRAYESSPLGAVNGHLDGLQQAIELLEAGDF